MKSNPIILALDIDEPKEAQNITKKLAPFIGGVKLGPRLTLRADKNWLKDIAHSGTLFLDHKFFDIPSTTEASVKAAFDLGADWVTVHALNGSECLKKLSTLEKTLQEENEKFRIVVVTVLTSFTAETLPQVWVKESIQNSVMSLASEAYEQGLNTFVCSPQEIKTLKSKHRDCFVITPGVRSHKGLDDQKRTATAKEAMQMGADALVIGRPIYEAKDPVGACKEILETL